MSNLVLNSIPAFIVAMVVATCCADAACGGGASPPPDDAGSGPGSQDEWDQLLATRMTDYGAALKTAALRLTGDLPTMTEIAQVANAPYGGRRAAYEALVHDYLGRPAFARQMFYFWRDTFKIGGTAAFDTAPAFAAKLSVENGSYMDLMTKTTANCPTFDEAMSAFSDAECTNGGPRAGVLTNPGVMAQFASNLGFRRVRWVQETFDCVRFPAELTGSPQDVGGVLPYLGAWPFNSVASPTNGGGRINFQDVSSAICMNCHQTMNHIAPLFAYYDMAGTYSTTISVPTPLAGAPLAALSDYLPASEATAWRFRVPAADLPALGAAMAADTDVARCGVARIWNWVFGKNDIVDVQAEVPLPTIESQLEAFTQNGYKIKDLIFAIFDSEDFVKY